MRVKKSHCRCSSSALQRVVKCRLSCINHGSRQYVHHSGRIAFGNWNKVPRGGGVSLWYWFNIEW